jgi:hypothetical protein
MTAPGKNAPQRTETLAAMAVFHGRIVIIYAESASGWIVPRSNHCRNQINCGRRERPLIPLHRSLDIP